MNAELSGDLASVLNTQKMDSQTSEKLRDFFQKLVQADLKIKKLKQDMNHYYQNDNLNSFPERFKRSLKNHINNHHSRAFNDKKRKKKNFKRNLFKDKKRSFKNRFNVTGFVIEEEKVLVQYETGRKRNFPKCSHSHETKSHEKKLKHPFYKHSQRIDEMLKYKKPEMVTNNLFQKENDQKTSKRTTNKMALIDYKVYDDNEDAHTGNVKEHTKIETEKETTFDLETFLSTTPLYDVALSVSSFINPWEDRSNSKTPQISTNNRMGYRKLMEADEEDDEELNYDIKEVLSDDHQERDLMDSQVEIKKRDIGGQFDPDHYKYYPSQILNPNWKGPMPFYPDEINAMIKHAAMQNYNIKAPVGTHYMKSDRDKIKKDVSDTEYIENYADNKFNRMVKMAQAYSDYGVVYNKKNEDSKDKIDKPDSRFKQSLGNIFIKNDPTNTPTCGGSSEGIRFEYRKGNIDGEHKELIKDITKHIKFLKHPMHEDHSTTLTPMIPDYENINSLPHFNLHINTLEVKPLELAKTAKPNKKIKFDPRKGSRSLKSIESSDDTHENNNISTEFNPTSKRNTTNIDSILSFLAVMGDWFRTLSNLSAESNGLIGNSMSINITQPNSTKSKMLEANKSSDILYPSYDSDMVDNIGHRSRVLMSVAENNTIHKSHERHIDTESSNQSDSDNIVPIALILAANTPNKSKENDTSKKENMTSIVKRSIDDSKLVFWNDLYDDNEYGIKLDYADNTREQHLVKSRGVMQKSKAWIQGKFNNLTGKVKNKLKTTNNKKPIACGKINVNQNLDLSKPKKRNARNSNDNPETSLKKNFAALNSNMKRVCQEAAKAVQNTRNIEVRDDNKERTVATSLMQQLVGLMTDLVNIQVQQKTCAKLPSDLQSFLEWLTAPVENNVRVDDLTPGLPDYVAVDDGFARFDKSTQSDFGTTLSEDSHQDDRTECLGTIRAVQDLIQQYEGMNDDDKSKMSGVKEYLKNQLDFLNKKLNDKVNSSKLYEKLPRIKRDSPEKQQKIIKYFNKKHTRTTLNDYVTENTEDKIILNNKLTKNNINNNLGVKIMDGKLTKDEIKKS